MILKSKLRADHRNADLQRRHDTLKEQAQQTQRVLESSQVHGLPLGRVLAASAAHAMCLKVAATSKSFQPGSCAGQSNQTGSPSECLHFCSSAVVDAEGQLSSHYLRHTAAFTHGDNKNDVQKSTHDCIRVNELQGCVFGTQEEIVALEDRLHMLRRKNSQLEQSEYTAHLRAATAQQQVSMSGQWNQSGHYQFCLRTVESLCCTAPHQQRLLFVQVLTNTASLAMK